MKLAVLKNYKKVGKLHGNGNSFESGNVKHFNFDDITSLGKLLKITSKNPLYSVCIGTFPRDGEVKPKQNAQIGDMTRTKDIVNTGHIMVLDNDFGQDYDINLFVKHWDIFEGAGYIKSRSGSTILGKKKHGSHVYFIVKDGIRNLKRALEILEDICIIEGLCAIEFHKTGKAVVKTPIDKALSQNSRVVYEDDVDLKIVDGSTISLSEFPKNLKRITDKAAKIRKTMLRAVEDESYERHAEYVKKTTGKKLKKKKKIKDSLEQFDKHEVDENFKLHLDGNYMGTVGDLILGRIDSVYFSDLYEPDYGGGGQKAIYFPESKTFFSQAHGGITYKIKCSEKFDADLIEEFLKCVPYLEDAHNISNEFLEIIKTRDIVARKRMIREYAKENGVTPTDVEKELNRLTILKNEFDKFYDLWLQGKYDETVNPEKRLKNYIEYKDNVHMVNVGGKVVFVSKYRNDENNVCFSMNPITVERELWSDRKSRLMKVDKESGETTFTDIDTPDLFVDGTKADEAGIINPCKRYTGLDFAPNEKLDIAFNLFSGFPITPIKGDISVWKKHMIKSYGKDHYNFIMDWFADMYQHPDRKVNYAIVVKGEKGTGKTLFEDVLGRQLLSNENYFRTANKQQLFGKFNSHLLSNLLIVGQEVTWGGSHDHDSVLKDMITEQTRVIEKKGIDSFTVKNFSRMYITSNSDWVVPASKDERRFYVAQPKKVHSKKDWDAFYKWLRTDGVKEALMYEMLNRDLSSFNNVFCPITKELAEQKIESLYGVERFVFDAFSNGYFGTYKSDKFDTTIPLTDGMKVKTVDLFSMYSDMYDVRKLNLIKFGIALAKCGLSEKRKIKGHNYLYIENVDDSFKTFKAIYNL